jgi:site-specific recombinase XerD
MSTITLFLKDHEGQQRIFLEFAYSAKINSVVRKLPGAEWSQSNKKWHLPAEQKSVDILRQKISPLHNVDTALLKKQLEERNKRAIEEMHSPVEMAHYKKAPLAEKLPLNYQKRIQPVNGHIIPMMFEHLKLKAYSASTIKTYLYEMGQLLQTLGHIPADELMPEHLKRYLLYCVEKLGLRENTLHSRINSLKFYYEQVLKREKFFWDIPRPKKPLLLPEVLSEVEIGRLFRAIENIKHKAIVFTAYSAGLRVSEVVNLKIKNVDSHRMTLFIEKAKGKKDRIVNLSPLLLDILRSYLLKWQPRPLNYLFEGAVAGEAYSARSAQLIFHDARMKAGIHKDVSFHALRHSFATHLLEKGVDIRYIKDILGHFDIRTTERYTHVSKRLLVNIGSPLDDLVDKGIIEFSLAQPTISKNASKKP